ncbi:MAG: radical SAM protein [Planctomycetota bacterium]
MKSSYLTLLKSGELGRRVVLAKEILKKCILCPRRCEANRLNGELGFCKSGVTAVFSSAGPHYGEEPPISGPDVHRGGFGWGSAPSLPRGSGTIFFTGCNLRCLFCQNYQISQEYLGRPVAADELGQIMISLQEQGCHNINLVSPTHFVPQILESLLYAAENGLVIPIVYNTNGYDSIETLKLMEGVVDIYLPDIKYSENKQAEECSRVADYVEPNRLALKEMYRQVGNLVTDENGIARRGLLVRHLVLPQDKAGSFDSLEFIVREISGTAYLSLMSQYHPCYQAHQHPVLNRRLSRAEYEKVVNDAESLGLENCYIQNLISSDDFIPDFQKEKPFSR